MRKLRILFIIAGLTGAFYLNGAGNQVQASPIHCEFDGWDYSNGCTETWWRCDDNATGEWCYVCESGDVITTSCINW